MHLLATAQRDTSAALRHSVLPKISPNLLGVNLAPRGEGKECKKICQLGTNKYLLL